MHPQTQNRAGQRPSPLLALKRWLGWATPYVQVLASWLTPYVEEIGWAGSAMGVIGALTLAVNQPWSGLGWYFFLGSNTTWILYGAIKRVSSLLLMQAVFTITSLIGIVRWSA